MVKLIKLSFRKLFAFSGGLIPLAIAAVLLLSCAYLIDYASSTERRSALVIACVDLDKSAASSELISLLTEGDSISVTLCSGEAEGKKSLTVGMTEGLLIIGRGYENALSGSDTPPLTYETAAMASSAMLLRETVSGIAAAQSCRYRAYLEANELTNGLTEAQRVRFDASLDAAAENSFLETMTLKSGETRETPQFVYSGIFARQTGFAALVVMLCVLSVSAWFSDKHTRLVGRRMAVFRNGRRISALSDVASLLIFGAGCTLLTLIPVGKTTLLELALYLGYLLFLTALCLLIARRFHIDGRADATAPYIAIITGALGGSLADFGQFSGWLKTAALFTPQGLLLEGIVQKTLWPLAVLIAATAVMLWAAYVPRHRLPR